MKFIKYEDFWWQWDDESSKLDYAKLIRPYYNPSYVNANDLELVEVESWNDLNWYGTKLYDDKYDTGWLDRNGKFYGCAYEYHEEQAEFVHKVSEEDLERKGFVKITKDFDGSLIAYFSGDLYDDNIRPSKAQEKYLSILEKTKNCLFWYVSDQLDDEIEPNN